MNPHDIVRRCDEGLAKLRADLARGGKESRGCENRIAALEKTRADALDRIEKAERASAMAAWPARK